MTTETQQELKKTNERQNQVFLDKPKTGIESPALQDRANSNDIVGTLTAGSDFTQLSRIQLRKLFEYLGGSKDSEVMQNTLVEVLANGKLADGRTLDAAKAQAIIQELSKFKDGYSVLDELNNKANKQRFIYEALEALKNDTADIFQGNHATCASAGAESSQAEVNPVGFVKEAVGLALYGSYKHNSQTELKLPANTNEILKSSYRLTYVDEKGATVTKADNRTFLDKVVQTASANITESYNPVTDTSRLDFTGEIESGLYSKDCVKLLEAKSPEGSKYGLIFKENYSNYSDYKNDLLMSFQSHLDPKDPKMQIISIDLGGIGRHSNHAMKLKEIKQDENGKWVVVLENTWHSKAVIKGCSDLRVKEGSRSHYKIDFDKLAERTNFFVSQVAKNGEYQVSQEQGRQGYWEAHALEDDVNYQTNPESLKFVRGGSFEVSGNDPINKNENEKTSSNSVSVTRKRYEDENEDPNVITTLKNRKKLFAQDQLNSPKVGRDLNAVSDKNS